jgi:hypothetical protein
MEVVNIDFLGSAEEGLKKVKAALEKQRKDQDEANKMAQLDDLIHKLGNMAYKDIVDITSSGKAPLAIFLLCTCLIEQLATYRYGSNGNIKKFVKQYMPQYDSDVMHEMRNRINHNYSLHEKYALTIGARNAHLVADRDGTVIINMENFVEELGIVFNKFATDLRQDKGIRNNALNTLKTYGILNQAMIEVIIPDSDSKD